MALLATVALGMAISVVATATASSAEGEASYVAITPERLLDTRPGFQIGEFDTPWFADSTRTLAIAGFAGVPAENVDSVVLNITTVNPSAASSYLTVFPTGASQPTTSALNFGAGETKNDIAVVALGPNGTIQIYNAAGSVDLVIDVAGFFTTTLEGRVSALEAQGSGGTSVSMQKTMTGVMNVASLECGYQVYVDGYGCGFIDQDFVNGVVGTGFLVDDDYYPSGAMGKLYISVQMATTNSEVCFRLRDETGAGVTGSEVCSITGPTPPTSDSGAPFLLESGPLTLAPGRYLVQSKADGTGQELGGQASIFASAEPTLALVSN